MEIGIKEVKKSVNENRAVCSRGLCLQDNEKTELAAFCLSKFAKIWHIQSGSLLISPKK
jgi:hypothetical protein